MDDRTGPLPARTVGEYCSTRREKKRAGQACRVARPAQRALASPEGHRVSIHLAIARRCCQEDFRLFDIFQPNCPRCSASSRPAKPFSAASIVPKAIRLPYLGMTQKCSVPASNHRLTVAAGTAHVWPSAAVTPLKTVERAGYSSRNSGGTEAPPLESPPPELYDCS